VEALCLSKILGMHIKSFIKIYNIHLSISILLMVYPCFAFKKYTITSVFPFRTLF
jgi:hypothetical protein